MKTQIRTTVIVCAVLSALCTLANPSEDLAQIAALSAELKTNGISGMLALAAKNEWRAPWIPDQWHVENVVKDPEIAKVADAGRDFRVDLTGRLDEISEELHRPVSAEVFYGRSVELCGLAEWISQPEALGNLLLTGRCLDLAGVGIIRLVANTNFPVERCEALLETLDNLSVLIAPPRRARILDAEADAKIFARCKTTEDLQQVWEAGVRRNRRADMLLLKEMGAKLPDSVFSGYVLVSDSVLEQRKSFFAILESPDPLTSRNYRGKENSYLKAVIGVESRSPTKAHHLLEFRKEVGYFPKPWVRSEEERAILDKEIALYAKYGATITPAEQDPSFDPLKVAFQKAWYQKVSDPKRCNEYVWALMAYKEVLEEREK